jgi:hypothetical protein
MHPPDGRARPGRPALEVQLPDLDLPAVDRERATEGEFVADLVEAANAVRHHLLITAGLIPLRTLATQEEAIAMGHMVRLYKLYDTVCFLLSQGRTEPANLIVRCVVDTAICLSYLAKFGDRAVFESFVRSSLWYEKHLKDIIVGRMGAKPTPIEERNLRSIDRTIQRAGHSPDDTFTKRWGPSTADMAGCLNRSLDYEIMYRIGCHAVHGTWHELEFDHLSAEEEGYCPDLTYTTPRPQILEGATLFAIRAAVDYLDWIGADPAGVLSERLATMGDWFLQMSYAHEALLARTGAPEGDGA